MSVRELAVVGFAAVAGYVITILLLPSMGLEGDPGPPFTGGLILATAAALLLLARRLRSADRGR